jgi:hypothetical protein
MSDISSLLSNEVYVLDREILFLITKGNPSSYAVWAAMNRQMQGQGLAYVNIKKRIKRMVEMGILQRVDPAMNTTGIRGRKEYKLTEKAMEPLIPYLLSQSEDLEPISKYIYKSGLDRKVFENILNHRIFNILVSGNSYYRVAGQIAKFPSKDITNIWIVDDIEEPKPVIMKATAADRQRLKEKDITLKRRKSTS